MDGEESAKAGSDTGRRGTRIIPFRPKMRGAKANQPPVVNAALRSEQDNDRLRMRQNLAAAVVLALLLLSGVWVIDELAASSRIEACIEAGHRNCASLELGRHLGR
jgi:hypothetical protein